jgi:hypothetical protein
MGPRVSAHPRVASTLANLMLTSLEGPPIDGNQEHVEQTPAALSTAHVREIDRSSPTPSTASLEKYLATSPSEEGLVHEGIWSTWGAQELPDLASFMESHLPPPSPSIANSASITSSDSSMCSTDSTLSCTSFKSTDPRGARRGRKRWHPPASESIAVPKPHPQPHLYDGPLTCEYCGHKFSGISAMRWLKRHVRHKHGASPASVPRYFCTWPDCDSVFHRNDVWSRHESTKHFTHVHWVCCPDPDPDRSTPLTFPCFVCDEAVVTIDHVKKHHFGSCLGKDIESRKFLRKDHLVQHIKGTHLKHVPLAKPVPDELLVSCLMINPPTPEALYCGICGRTFTAWPYRQAHVARHMNTGKHDKSSWRSYPPPFPSPSVFSEEGSEDSICTHVRGSSGQ